MPKRSKNRSGGSAGGLRDDDYEWIKSLGDGRATASATATAATAERPNAAGGSGRLARRALPAAPARKRPEAARDEFGETGPATSATSGPGSLPIRRRHARPEREYWQPRDASSPAERVSEPDSSGSRPPTKPGRAVRLTAGRAVDLQANPADALFNPAAEEYGQPLYAVPNGSDDGTGWPGQAEQATPGPGGRVRQDETDPQWPVPGLSTGEYRRPLYPLRDSGSRVPTGPQPAWHDDPFADTDARGRRIGRFTQQSAGPRALPAGGTDTNAWPAATGWAKIDGGSAALAPSRNGHDSAPPQPEATGWPATGNEQEPASWREPTGWPEATEQDGFTPGQDHARAGVPSAGAVPPAAPPAQSPARGKQKSQKSGRRQEPAGRKAAGRKAASGRKSKAAIQHQTAIASVLPRSADVTDRPGQAEATSTATLVRAVPAQRPGSGARKGRKRGRRGRVLACLVVIAAAAVAAYVVLWPKTSHLITTPAAVGSYLRQNANPTAEQFKHRLMASAGNDVKNVVAAAYQRSTGPGTKNGPQIVVFIGGNLAGNASASSLISAYMRQMSGAFGTSPGKLGGRAACAPGSSGGRPAECAWADGDTFGVVVSATLGPAALANEMRLMRPHVERVTR